MRSVPLVLLLALAVTGAAPSLFAQPLPAPPPPAPPQPAQPLPDLRCPDTPNCVSTEATQPAQRMDVVPFADAPKAAQARARLALRAEARTVIVADTPGLLRAEATSRIFRFVDDVTVVIDAEARVFRFRSASRVGRSDLGVNRRRMARVVARLVAPGGRP